MCDRGCWLLFLSSLVRVKNRDRCGDEIHHLWRFSVSFCVSKINFYDSRRYLSLDESWHTWYLFVNKRWFVWAGVIAVERVSVQLWCDRIHLFQATTATKTCLFQVEKYSLIFMGFNVTIRVVQERTERGEKRRVMENVKNNKTMKFKTIGENA